MTKNKVLNLGLLVLLLLTLLSIGGCVPAEETTGGFDWTIIIFLVLIFGIFYLLLIRPQRKRQKQHQQLMQDLNKGDKVITAGGIYGQIESLSQDSVVLKIESGTTIRVARSSIVGKQERY